MEPEQVLALLALGLILGPSWPNAFRTAWLVFAVAIVVGLAAGFALAGDASPGWPLLALALAAAILAVAAAKLPGIVTVMFSVGAGLLIGIASTPEPGPLRATIITVAGSWVGANLILFYAAGGVGWLRARFDRPWAHVGLRVVGSWIGAIACLMFALGFTS